MKKFLNVVFLFQSFSGLHQTMAESKTFNVQETFIRFEFSLIACYKKTRLHFRKELIFYKFTNPYIFPTRWFKPCLLQY